MPCPACKIIIDGGRIAAAADLYADEHPRGPDSPAAKFLARIVRANTDAIIHGIKSGVIAGEDIGKAHAWSELQCHRAEAIEGGSVGHAKFMLWAEEDRKFATELVGGEYSGAWTVNGTEGITPKE